MPEADRDRIYLSVVTLAELRHGIEQMTIARSRNRLREELPLRFDRRVLPIDAPGRGRLRLQAAERCLVQPLGVAEFRPRLNEVPLAAGANPSDKQS